MYNREERWRGTLTQGTPWHTGPTAFMDMSVLPIAPDAGLSLISASAEGRVAEGRNAGRSGSSSNATLFRGRVSQLGTKTGPPLHNLSNDAKHAVVNYRMQRFKTHPHEQDGIMGRAPTAYSPSEQQRLEASSSASSLMPPRSDTADDRCSSGLDSAGAIDAAARSISDIGFGSSAAPGDDAAAAVSAVAQQQEEEQERQRQQQRRRQQQQR